MAEHYVQPYMATPKDLPAPTEGWAFQVEDITWTLHYYRGDMALCHYAKRAPVFYPGGENGSPDKCRVCLRKLREG